MKVIVCHNFYQRPGGEDQVFADETALLESHGHEVTRFTVHNDDIEGAGRLAMVGRTVWNRSVHAELAAIVKRERAQVVHFHNTFPLMSPAAYYAARSQGAAVVQTLHNYRLFCPAGVLYRNGKVCEECLGKAVPWPAVARGCYRGSRPATAVAAGMLSIHRAMGSWNNGVDAYVALSEFARRKYVQGGLPADRVIVKPNFVAPDPGVGRGDGNYVVFVGRLEAEKGVETLLHAWQTHMKGVRLKILGHGPLAHVVQRAVAECEDIEWLGRLPQREVHEAIGRASLLVIPSQWYEGFPKTLLEAYAKGTPVAVSRIGSLEELVDNGRTGLHFEPGNADDLAAKVRLMLGDPLGLLCMRANVRHEFETKYSPEQNYQMLRGVYDVALAHFAGKPRPTSMPLDVLSSPPRPASMPLDVLLPTPQLAPAVKPAKVMAVAPAVGS